MRKVIMSGLLLAALAGVLCLYVLQAANTPVQPFDEPLWFARSRISPLELGTPRYRAWAVDIAVANRWAWWAVLRATGLDQVPADEPPAWTLRGGRVYWRDSGEPIDWRPAADHSFDRWLAEHGCYAPVASILAMRLTDVAAFAACVFLLWLTARMALRSGALALLAALPLILSPLFATEVSFVVSGGDVFLAAALSAVLAALVYAHMKGLGTSWVAVVVVATLAGVAAGAKHTGVLAVAAHLGYLAWQARGADRFVKPIAALAMAFLAFAAVNPAVFYAPGERPWNILMMMAAKRAEVAARHVSRGQPLSVLELFRFFWWPLLPAASYAMWACRKQPWFPAVLPWAVALVAGTLLGVAGMRTTQPRYLAPLEMGVYFPMALAIVALTAGPRHRAADAVHEEDAP